MKLKYKFLFLFTSVFFVALIVLSLLNINLFRKDKIAYVFSAMIESSQTASLILKTQVSAQTPLIELVSSQFDYTAKKIPVERRSLLQMSDSIQYLQIEELVGDKFVPLDAMGLLGENQKSILAQSPTNLETNIVFFPETTDQFAIQKKIEMKGLGSGQYRIALVMKKNPLKEIINQPKFYDLFLMSKRAQVIQRPEQVSEKKFNGILAAFFKEHSIQNQASVTKNIGVNDEEYMVTWAPLGYGDLGFVSLLKADKALQALTKAKYISLAILCLLLGIGLTLVMVLVGQLTKNIEKLSSSMTQFSSGDLEVRSEIQSEDEVGLLSSIFNQMTEKIKDLLNDTAHKVRMESELATARTVQQRLLPSKVNHESAEGIICGHYEPASECGGDWWFYFEEEKFFYFIIADVTGHGVPSALITSALRASVAAQSHFNKSNLADFVATINRVIADSASGAINATSFVGRYSKDEQQIEYVNVSHCPPIIMRKSSGEQDCCLEISGPRLGEKREAVYRTYKIPMNPGDVLFAYTDGLSEFTNAAGKMFGDRRIFKLLKKYWDEKSKLNQYRSKLLKDFSDYKQESPLDDDLTFFFFQAK